MKKIVLLGASGSIGLQTLDVLRQHPDEYTLAAFGVGRQIDKARTILAGFPVSLMSVAREEDAIQLSREYPDVTVLHGDEALVQLSAWDGYDLLVNALVGFTGFMPTLTAIEHGHDVALANKETLVCGGELIQKALQEHGCSLYPIDSEHSAIWQCLQGNKKEQVNRLIVTCSGGAFRNRTREELKYVTVEDALAHPTWTMGAKITIDSANLMNKGFEVIEAHWLFDLPYDRIDVLMHPESVIHSMVEYCDHSLMAQLGAPDMRLPIQYALSWPDRWPLSQEHPLDLAEIATLHFAKPDLKRYPLLELAYESGRKGKTYNAVMNAANDVANAAFRNHEIPFPAVEQIIQETVHACPGHSLDCLKDLEEANQWGRAFAGELVEGVKRKG